MAPHDSRRDAPRHARAGNATLNRCWRKAVGTAFEYEWFARSGFAGLHHLGNGDAFVSLIVVTANQAFGVFYSGAAVCPHVVMVAIVHQGEVASPNLPYR